MAEGAFFGNSVAVSGSLLVVGQRSVVGQYAASIASIETPILPTVLPTLATTPAVSSPTSILNEIVASDGAANDYFGASVAVSGSTVVVGAPGRNSEQGAAYVFSCLSASSCTQASVLTAGDGAMDLFGNSVAVSGSLVVVGSLAASHGRAFVFWCSSASCTQASVLTTSDGGADLFGCSVAASGSLVVVGAFAATNDTGAAYVFSCSISGCDLSSVLTASDGAAGDLFGSSVAVSGSLVVVGAYAANNYQGASYVFSCSSAGCSQASILAASDGVAGDRFGVSIAVSGSVVVVGADARKIRQGAAYVFSCSSSGCSQTSVLAASDGVQGDLFGSAVAVSDSLVLVSANRNSNQGVVYAFYCPSASSCTQSYEFFSGVGAADSFGASVAVSGSLVLVGADTKQTANSTSQGAAFVGLFLTPAATTLHELVSSDGTASSYFGDSVAVSGSLAAVGAYLEDDLQGAAYVFSCPSASSCAQASRLVASDGALGDFFGGSVAVSGALVVVGATGANNQGAAYVFSCPTASNCSQASSLAASDGAPNDNFGVSVAVSGALVVVGASGKNSDQGAAYVFFCASGAGCVQATILTASDGAANDFFGASVAVSGSVVVVGAPGENSGQGAASVFSCSSIACASASFLTASDGAAGDDFGVSVAISGSLILIGADGRNARQGVAYLFVCPSAFNCAQVSVLSPSDGAANSYFGYSVAVDGSVAVVGAKGRNGSEGAAYVFFCPSPSSCAQSSILSAGDGAVDFFGYSVAVSGSLALVGALTKRVGNNSDQGAAFAGNLGI